VGRLSSAAEHNTNQARAKLLVGEERVLNEEENKEVVFTLVRTTQNQL